MSKPETRRESTNGPNELTRESRLTRANTRASLMSDTKWRKLLVALNEANLNLPRCIVKFVGVPGEKSMKRPRGFSPPRPWIDTIEFGPIPLRSIEWLLFPLLYHLESPDRTIPIKTGAQDVDAAARIAAALGRYPGELSERGLLITGHLPTATVAAQRIPRAALAKGSQ